MLRKIYTWLLILFVILSLYSINIMTFTVADAILLALFPIYFLDAFRKNQIKIHFPLTFCTFYIIIHMFLMMLLFNSFEIFMPTMRFVGYLLFVAIFARSYFDINLGKKLLKYISIISTVYLIIQFIFMNYFNYYLTGFIPWLPLDSQNLYTLNEQFYSISFNRPRSFFQEPAHYASFVLVYFSIGLFDNPRKNYFGLLIIGIGLIISGSLTGIITAIGLLLLKVIKLIRKLPRKKISANFLVVSFVLSIGTIIVTNTTAFNYALYRLFESDQAYIGRLGNYSEILTVHKGSIIGFLFGHGMVELNNFIPAFPRIFVFFGILGVIAFLLYMILLIISTKGYKRAVLITLLISIIGTEIILGKFILLYLPFIINYGNPPKKKEKH